MQKAATNPITFVKSINGYALVWAEIADLVSLPTRQEC
jgi:hypothetical protein